MASLAVDSEEFYHLLYEPLTFVAAKTILVDSADVLLEKLGETESLFLEWWRFRCLVMHQRCIDSSAATLHDQIMNGASSLLEKIDCLFADSSNEKNIRARVQFRLEFGLAQQLYNEAGKATRHFTAAQELGGLNVCPDRITGQGTKFQQDDVSQLVLHAVSSMDINDVASEQAPETRTIGNTVPETLPAK